MLPTFENLVKFSRCLNPSVYLRKSDVRLRIYTKHYLFSLTAINRMDKSGFNLQGLIIFLSTDRGCFFIVSIQTRWVFCMFRDGVFSMWLISFSVKDVETRNCGPHIKSNVYSKFSKHHLMIRLTYVQPHMNAICE